MKSAAYLLSTALFGLATVACAPRPSYVAANSKIPLEIDSEGRHGPDPESISPEAMKDQDVQAPQAAPEPAPAASQNPVPAPKPAPETTPVPAQNPTPSKNQAPAPTPAPKPAPAPLPAPAPTPGGDEQAKFQAMLKAGEVLSNFDVKTYQGWGTSAQNRIEVAIAVDNAGNPLTIRNPSNTQVVSSVDGKKEGSFGPGLHSALKICNQSDKPVYMHSGKGSPFAHAQKPIKVGDCAKFLVGNADAVRDGANYDHAAGGAKENWIYMRIKKIKPDGSVMK